MNEPIGIVCTSIACGGLELNVLRMAEWLHSAGYQVTLIGTGHSELARRCRCAHVRFFPLRSFLKYIDIFAALRLRKIVRSRNIRTLIVNTSADMMRAILAKVLSPHPVKLIYVQHMQIGVKKRDLFHTWQYRRLDAWISPLPFLARQVTRMTRVNPARIFEIPFGINLDDFIEEKPCRTRARLRLGLPLDAIIVGVVGRLDPQKNQALLLQAAAKIIHTGIPLKILIVGANTLDNGVDYLSKLESLTQALQISGSVFFRPFLEDVNTAYAALDIFTLTSESESFGMVTIEAMAAGLPVIATRQGGTPDLVDDKRTGFLFDGKSAADLEAALQLLIHFPELRREFGKAGRKKAIESFSHVRQISHLSEVVESIA